MLTVLGDGRALPAAGKLGVETLRQAPDSWLTFPARDRLHRWLDDRKKRKQITEALDDALEALIELTERDPSLRVGGELFNERFFRDRQVMGTLVACFTAEEPVDYDLLVRNVSFGTEQQRRRVLEAFVGLLRAHLAAANPEFRLTIPVQSAARVKAIQNAAHAQAQRPPEAVHAPASQPPEKTASGAIGQANESIAAIRVTGDTRQTFAQAVELEAQGQIEEAIALYEYLLRQAPDDGKAHFNLAMLLVEQLRLEEAEQHCWSAVQMLHDYPDAWGLQAYLLSSLGRQAESLECARRAVALGFPRKRLAGLLKLEPAAL